MNAAACSVLKGADRFELTDQVRISPVAKLFGPGHNYVRCLSVRRHDSVLTDIDNASQVIERPVRRIWQAIQPLEPQFQSAGKSTREHSKTACVLELLRRPQGATVKEIMTLTDWQSHTVRGFLSGTVGKRMGLAVHSQRRENGERVYHLESTPGDHRQ